jgi:elongator complex protein 3
MIKSAINRFVVSFSDALMSGRITDKHSLLAEKRRICAYLGLTDVPKNGEILSVLDKKYITKFAGILKSKPVRTLSGVTVVALMTKPFDCPHGVCLFCPGGTKFNTPQSYTGFEPAARRAKMNNYDPYEQIQARLKHYVFMGYEPQKIEVIVIGGTFTTLPKIYRDEFVTQIYHALNDFPIHAPMQSVQLKEQEKINETGPVRCVTFAVETKPERCEQVDINQLLEYGVTRVEMGVQSIYDDVLKRNNRGHTIRDVIDTTKRLRNNAYKVDYHIMLNLPFSDIDKDKETIRAIYENEDFKPDAIKIYPTLVINGTGLYNLWKRGLYKSYPLQDIVELIADAEIKAPSWLRIMRIERDIPSNLVKGGIKITNLRQLVDEYIKARGKSANDIRSREIGHLNSVDSPTIRLNREDYRAAAGDEIFLSIDSIENNAIIGFLRLRIPDSSMEGLIRELHIYGEQQPIYSYSEQGFQHKGLGRELLSTAEEIVKSEYSLKRMKIISGVGVREYYRKEGYILENAYMVKRF